MDWYRTQAEEREQWLGQLCGPQVLADPDYEEKQGNQGGGFDGVAAAAGLTTGGEGAR